MIRAIYGGSFDPPHVSHVLAVQYILSVGLADRVVVVPVYDHALSKELSAFDQRVTMCRAAFQDDARVIVSTVERELPRPSYTLRTILALQQQFPDDQLRLVIGADVLGETQKWHQFERVAEEAPPIVLGRRGVEHPNAPPALLPEVSSSEIRQLCREAGTGGGQAAERLQLLVPAAVRRYIDEYGLYRGH